MSTEQLAPTADRQSIGAFIAAQYAVAQERPGHYGPSMLDQAVGQILAAEAQLVEALRCLSPVGLGVDLPIQQTEGDDQGGLFVAVPGSVVGVVSTADLMQRVALHVRVEVTGKVYEVPLGAIIGQVALASS
jgi:hypothetical protein